MKALFHVFPECSVTEEDGEERNVLKGNGASKRGGKQERIRDEMGWDEHERGLHHRVDIALQLPRVSETPGTDPGHGNGAGTEAPSPVGPLGFSLALPTFPLLSQPSSQDPPSPSTFPS